MTGCDLCGVGPDDDCTDDCPSRRPVPARPTLDDLASLPVYQGPVRDRRDPGVVAAFRSLLHDDPEPVRLIARAVSAHGGTTLRWSTEGGPGTRRLTASFEHVDDLLCVSLLADALGWRLLEADALTLDATLRL